jgi:predicted nucleic acid-binding protein
MPSVAVVDAGPLVAAADEDEPRHARCLAVLSRPDLRLVIPTMVVTETTYFIERRLGPRAEATFLRGLARLDVEAPLPEDWERIAQLVEQYADFPLGGTDASVIALAERLRTDVVITLDRRHFGAVRPRHVESLRLLPE